MAVNPFEMVISRMYELGMFQFLFPFMLSSAIFYGLLRKSQIFGKPEDNVAVNAIVALVASFLVWSAPIIMGIDIQTMLIPFFVQSLSATLVIMMGLLIAGMFFPPDLPGLLKERFQTGGFWSVVIVGGVLIGFVILLTSGLGNIFFPPGEEGIAGLSEDVVTIVLVVIILAVSTVAVVGIGGKKKE